jgi:hypothetical protein
MIAQERTTELTGANALHTIRRKTGTAPDWVSGSGVDMPSETLRLIIAGSLLLHAIAHALALLALLAGGLGLRKGNAVSSRSGQFLRLTPRAGSVIGFVIWAVSTTGFLAASAGFWGTLAMGETWRTIAVASSCVSTLGIIVRGGTWPGAASAGRSALNTLVAITMNIAILVALVGLRWPPQAMFGR